MLKHQLTDTEILQKINAGEVGAIEHFYDKYAPNVFGIISLLSKNKSLNELLLLQLFTNLKDDIKPALQCRNLMSWLYGYTFKFTLTELYARGIEPNIDDIKNSPLLIQRIYNTFLANHKASAQIIEITTEPYPSIMRQYKWLPIYGSNQYNVE